MSISLIRPAEANNLSRRINKVVRKAEVTFMCNVRILPCDPVKGKVVAEGWKGDRKRNLP